MQEPDVMILKSEHNSRLEPVFRVFRVWRLCCFIWGKNDKGTAHIWREISSVERSLRARASVPWMTCTSYSYAHRGPWSLVPDCEHCFAYLLASHHCCSNQARNLTNTQNASSVCAHHTVLLSCSTVLLAARAEGLELPSQKSALKLVSVRLQTLSVLLSCSTVLIAARDGGLKLPSRIPALKLVKHQMLSELLCQVWDMWETERECSARAHIISHMGDNPYKRVLRQSLYGWRISELTSYRDSRHFYGRPQGPSWWRKVVGWNRTSSVLSTYGARPFRRACRGGRNWGFNKQIPCRAAEKLEKLFRK